MDRNDSSAFEENALVSVQKRDLASLKDLIVSQIDQTIDANDNQAILLLVWYVQCLLGELSKARIEEDHDQVDLSSAELQSILQDIRLKPHIWTHRSKLYELFASYGDDDNYYQIATALDDTEALVDFLMKRKRYSEVIPLLGNKNDEKLLCKYGSALAKSCPEEFFGILMAKNVSEPAKLLPSILQGVNERNMKHLCRYLGQQVFGHRSKDKTLLFFLLSLYAHFDADKLLDFLMTGDRLLGDLRGPSSFDGMFLLSTCEEKKLTRASVKLLEKMNLLEEALDAALEVDINLAKEIAKSVRDDERLQKQLWLKIARKAVESLTCDINDFTNLHNESGSIEIADILPLLPDFTTIGPVKSAVCASLEEYTTNLEGLKEEMTEAAENVEEIKSDLCDWKNKGLAVKGNDLCEVCSKTVIGGAFYAYPCHHLFHWPCLRAEIETLRQPTDYYKDECIYCGTVMIDQIDQPLWVDEKWS